MRFFFTALAAASLLASVAWAHDFYTGKVNAEGQGCCGTKDCQPIPNSDIRVTRNGYEVRFLGDFFPVPQSRILHSPDGRFHACVWGGEVKCLFTPPMGS